MKTSWCVRCLLATWVLAGGASANAATGRLDCAAARTASACLQAALASRDEDVRVVPVDTTDMHATTVTILRQAGQSRVLARLQRDDGHEVIAWFRLERWRQVPVWGADAKSGEAASHGSPSMQLRDVAREPSAAGRATASDDTFATASLDDIATATLRRPVRAGDVVRRQDFRLPRDVVAGDSVRFELRDRGVRLRGRARALESGQVGDELRVLPATGGTPVVAVVTGVP